MKKQILNLLFITSVSCNILGMEVELKNQIDETFQTYDRLLNIANQERLMYKALYESEKSNKANKSNLTISTSINNVPEAKVFVPKSNNNKTRSFFPRPLFATFGLGLGIFGTLYYNGLLNNYMHGFNFSSCGTFSTLDAFPNLSIHNFTNFFNK